MSVKLDATKLLGRDKDETQGRGAKIGVVKEEISGGGGAPVVAPAK